MALDNSVVKQYDSVAEAHYYFHPNYRRFVDDKSNKIPVGDTLNIRDLEKALSPGNYVKGTKVPYTDADAVNYELIINQKPTINMKFDYEDLHNTNLPVMSDYAVQVANAFETRIDNDIRDAIVAKTPSASNPDLSLTPAAQTQANWDAVTGRKAIYSAIVKLRNTLIYDGKFPMDRMVLLYSSGVAGRLLEYVTEDVPNLGTGKIVDEAFINGEIGGKILGFKTMVDPDLTDTLGQASGTTKIYAFIANDTVKFAMPHWYSKAQDVPQENATAILTPRLLWRIGSE